MRLNLWVIANPADRMWYTSDDDPLLAMVIRNPYCPRLSDTAHICTGPNRCRFQHAMMFFCCFFFAFTFLLCSRFVYVLLTWFMPLPFLCRPSLRSLFCFVFYFVNRYRKRIDFVLSRQASIGLVIVSYVKSRGKRCVRDDTRSFGGCFQDGKFS